MHSCTKFRWRENVNISMSKLENSSKDGFTCITTSVDHCHIGICHVLALVLSIRCVPDGITDSAPAPPIPILQIKGDQAIHLGRHVSDVVGKCLAMLNIVHVAIFMSIDIMDILPICAVFCLRQKVSYPKYLLALTANENWHFGAIEQLALSDLYLHPLHVCTSSSSNVMVSMGCAKYTCS